MKKLKFLLVIIAVSQLVLWLISFFFPEFFLEVAMWLKNVNPDIGYPISMFSARLFAFWFGIFYILKNIEKNKFWIDVMIFIQVFDFIWGLIYVLNWNVALSAAAFPMFNAFVFSVLLYVFSRNNSIKFIK